LPCTQQTTPPLGHDQQACLDQVQVIPLQSPAHLTLAPGQSPGGAEEVATLVVVVVVS
jgi:hypothetical protein